MRTILHSAALLLVIALSSLLSLLSLSADCVAAEGEKPAVPYGDHSEDAYGVGKPVKDIKEARKVMTEYAKKRGLTFDEIREKELFFETDLKDSRDTVIDRIIVDKRTGRIRSAL